jgi:hypothetical protein
VFALLACRQATASDQATPLGCLPAGRLSERR